MTDDILRRAARALADETAEANESARFTRSRVMASLHQRERTRRSRVVFLLPIAAVLAGSTALAATGGSGAFQRVAAAIGIVDEAPAQTPPAPLERSTLARAIPLAELKAEPEPAAESAPPVAATDETADAEQEETVRPKAARTQALPPESDPTLALYREAHRLHFSAHDPARALAAWDRYLASAPNGRFATEARYNRAICLVRLGRRDEAKSALAPFAGGAYGTYRKDSAEALVQSLDGGS